MALDNYALMVYGPGRLLIPDRPLACVAQRYGPCHDAHPEQAGDVQGVTMILTVRFLGCEVLCIDLSDSSAPDEDTTRDLSGGELGSVAVQAGETDVVMGFSNGREA